MDRSHVGVGNVDGQDELRVHHRRLHLEGSELYRDQVEGRVLGLGGNDRRRSNRRRSSNEGGAPAPITLLLHCLRWRKEEEVGETDFGESKVQLEELQPTKEGGETKDGRVDSNTPSGPKRSWSVEGSFWKRGIMLD